MRRAFFVALIAAVPLIFGTASASAFTLPLPGGLGDITQLLSPKAPVAGTVVSTDPADGTFVANAYVVNPFAFLSGLGGGTSTPTSTQVTVSTDSNTTMLVNGQPGGVSDLAANEKFVGLFDGLPFDSIQTLTASPAAFIFAHGAPTAKQLYAFVGTVTGVDPPAGTITVNASDSLPSSLVAPNSSATFTVGAQTLILGGSSTGSPVGGLGGSLSDVSSGDIVAGGVIGSAGETLSQVEAQPLTVLLDLPAPPASSASAVKAKALREALALLEGKSVHTSKHRHSKHHNRRHHRG